MADIETLLRDGIAAVKRGDRATARKLLTSVIEQDAQNEKAWMWLAATSTNTEERRKFLLKVLELNPTNQRAQQALASLAMQSTPIEREPEPAPVASQQAEPERPKAKPAPPASATTPAPVRKAPKQDDLRTSTTPKKSALNVRGLIIGVLVLVLLIALVFFGLTLKDLLDKQNTPLIVAEADPTDPAPTFTLPPLPTETPYQIPTADGTRIGATLPPTYTPTPPPTEMPEATAPPTAIPQDRYVILFTVLQDGAQAPALYSMSGDGSNIQQVENNIRDIAYDPSGTKIAFVREVFVTNPAGEQVILPQIFVAPADNLAQATQITEQLGTTLKQLTWSPEAREIVFVSNHESEVEALWVIQVETGSLYRLTDTDTNASHPAWRPILGSREIIYTHEGTLGLEINKLEVREQDADLEIRRITNQPDSYAPSWNANGQRITFLSDRQLDADVYQMDSNGGDQRLVTRDDNGAEDRSPHYSPDGRFIAFVSNRLDGRFNIYLITPDGNSLTRLTEYQDADVIQLIYRPELFFRLSN